MIHQQNAQVNNYNDNNSSQDSSSLPEQLGGQMLANHSFHSKNGPTHTCQYLAEIIWLYSPQEQQTVLYSLINTNFKIIYGQNVIKMFTDPELVNNYIISKQISYNGILGLYQKMSDQQFFKGCSLYLVICTPHYFQFFVNKLSGLSQVFSRCLLFTNIENPNIMDNNNDYTITDGSVLALQNKSEQGSMQSQNSRYIYQKIMQVYDSKQIIDRLQKQIYEEKCRNIVRLFTCFNITLPEQDQIQPHDHQPTHLQSNEQGLQIKVADLQVSGRIQQSQTNLSSFPNSVDLHADLSEKQLLIETYKQIEQKLEYKIIKDILELNFCPIVSEQYMLIAILVHQHGAEEEEIYGFGNSQILVITAKKLKALLEQKGGEGSANLKLIIISSTLYGNKLGGLDTHVDQQELEISGLGNIYRWVKCRCKWAIGELYEQEADFYKKNTQLFTRESSESDKDERVILVQSVQQLTNQLNKCQQQISESL